MFKNNRGSEKISTEKCGGWQVMLDEPDLETRKFWRDKLGLVAVLSDGNIRIGDDIWRK